MSGYAPAVNHEGLARPSRPQARYLFGLRDGRVMEVIELGTAGYRRFSGALRRQGQGTNRECGRSTALILMGDWCVSAGHDNQVNEDRGAYHGHCLRRSVNIGV
jgi:hypothetical protein